MEEPKATNGDFEWAVGSDEPAPERPPEIFEGEAELGEEPTHEGMRDDAKPGD